jgi:hypothetical protein
MIKQLSVLVVLTMVIMTITTMTSITTTNVDAQSQGSGNTQPGRVGIHDQEKEHKVEQ